MIPKYIGNGAYCYANCVSMLLQSVGEDVSADLVEVLSGVGIGAFWDTKHNIGYFSNHWSAPPVGINNAFELLGFQVKEHIQLRHKNPPFEELKQDLKKTSAIIGPIDLHYLTNCGKNNKHGSDHFVFVYKITNSEVFIHDPHEYPCVVLPINHVLQIWKAENIMYKKGEYNYWTNPKRISSPSRKQLYKSSIQLFAETYRRKDCPVEVKNHDDAIRCLASFIRKNNGPSHLDGHLLKFSLPLGAKRALDYASFFEPHNTSLANLKDEQATLFGRTILLGKQDKWSQIAKTLDQIADVEERFISKILNLTK